MDIGRKLLCVGRQSTMDIGRKLLCVGRLPRTCRLRGCIRMRCLQVPADLERLVSIIIL